MKTDLNLGDKVTTWCSGKQVNAEIIEINTNDIVVEHEPVRWGEFTYTKTRVQKSTPLQMQFYSPTSPACFLNGEQIEF